MIVFSKLYIQNKYTGILDVNSIINCFKKYLCWSIETFETNFIKLSKYNILIMYFFYVICFMYIKYTRYTFLVLKSVYFGIKQLTIDKNGINS